MKTRIVGVNYDVKPPYRGDDIRVMIHGMLYIYPRPRELSGRVDRARGRFPKERWVTPRRLTL